MGDKKDILDDSRMRQLPYRVPQGYFEGLQTRLSEIPSAQAEKQSAFRSFIPKLAPYFAMAACFTLALLVGKYLAGRTGVEVEPAPLNTAAIMRLTCFLLREPTSVRRTKMRWRTWRPTRRISGNISFPAGLPPGLSPTFWTNNTL